jgi:hypothetical protein
MLKCLKENTRKSFSKEKRGEMMNTADKAILKTLKAQAKDKGFEWSTDYHPWVSTTHFDEERDLPYRDYAQHGYEQGYIQALKDFNLISDEE